jgi:uncharacterized protein
MVIHLRQMEHGSLVLEGEEEAGALGLAEFGIGLDGALSFQLEAGLSGGGIWAAGWLRLPVKLECVNCLERIKYVVEVPEFALQIPLEETGGRESIDLTPWVREDILLALPSYPKCDLDGGRDCLARFPTMEFAPAGETRGASETVWAALDTLQKEKSSEN